MPREIKNWRDGSQVRRQDFFVLADRNKGQRASEHGVYLWNFQFRDPEKFKSWTPRPGPLELIDALAIQKREDGKKGL